MGEIWVQNCFLSSAWTKYFCLSMWESEYFSKEKKHTPPKKLLKHSQHKKYIYRYKNIFFQTYLNLAGLWTPVSILRMAFFFLIFVHLIWNYIEIYIIHILNDYNLDFTRYVYFLEFLISAEFKNSNLFNEVKTTIKFSV